MSHVARYGKLVAHPGRGRELGDLLLESARGLLDEPGCLLYLVNRQRDAPDVVWVTELWRSQAELDAVLRGLRNNDDTAAILELVRETEMIELDELGGKGLPSTSE